MKLARIHHDARRIKEEKEKRIKEDKEEKRRKRKMFLLVPTHEKKKHSKKYKSI